MLTFRSIQQARSSGSLKSFRSVPNSTGISMAHLDRARMRKAEARREAAEKRQLWLTRQSYEHPAGSH